MEKEKKTIKCSYAILVIVLFATVCFLTDYILIERKTRNCDCPKCDVINNEVINDNTENITNEDNFNSQTSNSSICDHSNVCNDLLLDLLGKNIVLDSDFNVRTISDKISVVRFSMYSDVEVVDGSLLFKAHKYTIDDKSESIVLNSNYEEVFMYNIPNENIKYIYCFYYQPGGNTRIYALTKNNNLYLSEYNHLIDESDFNFDLIADFKMINSNVSNLKILDNSNTGCEECLGKSLYAVVNGELVKLL